MSKTEIRMKDKTLSKIHLNAMGKMVMEAVKAASNAASVGASAQPGGPNTAEETKGNSRVPPSGLLTAEPGTGAPKERIAPAQVVELNKQPEMKDLEKTPAQEPRTVLNGQATPEPMDPASTPADKAPHELHPGATAKNVLTDATAEDAEIRKEGADASESTGGEEAPLITIDLEHDVEY